MKHGGDDDLVFESLDGSSVVDKVLYNNFRRLVAGLWKKHVASTVLVTPKQV